MAHVTLGFPRHTPDIVWGSERPWSASRPLSLLGSHEPLNHRATSLSTQPADTAFYGILPETRNIGMVNLLRSNLTKSAHRRVKVWFDAARTDLVWESGIVPAVPEGIYDPLTDPQASWDSGNMWDASYTDAEWANARAPIPLYIPGDVFGQAISVEIFDEANPDGVVRIGLCEVAQAITVPVGTPFGTPYGLIDRDVLEEADGGVEYGEKRTPRKTYPGSFDHVPRETVLGQFYELFFQHGRVLPFFFWLDRDDPKQLTRTAFLARLASIDPFTIMLTEHDRVPFNVYEVL